MILSGTRKRFRTRVRMSSGITRERINAMLGQNTPIITSNPRNAITRPQCDSLSDGKSKQTAAAGNRTIDQLSTWGYLVMISSNTFAPSMTPIMKVVKSKPSGRFTSPSSLEDVIRAGVHMNTNTYIAPSNRDWAKPRYTTLGSFRELRANLQVSAGYSKDLIK